MLLLAPLGGVISDRWNRRTILLITQSSFALSALLLAILTYTGLIRYEFILALVLLNGLVLSVDLPTRQSLIAHLVEKRDLANGIALNARCVSHRSHPGTRCGRTVVGMGGTCALLFGERHQF
jgi:MFS family permease